MENNRNRRKYLKFVYKQEKCHNVADKYIEFEPVIILVDSMLLSQQAYRHALYNRDFKVSFTKPKLNIF